MKNTVVCTFVVAILMSSAAWAQKKETRNVESFTAVAFGVPGKLYLRQGSVQKVEIEGDAEDIEKVETDVRGNRLVIHSNQKWYNWHWGDSKVTVYITVPVINGISVSGSGNLVGEGRFTCETLDLNVSGSGNMEVEATVKGEIEADVSGSGGLAFKGRGASFRSSVSGSGNLDLDLNVTELASFGISGSGKINADGSANKTKVSISGSGGLRAEHFKTDVCDVRISGSGGITITVEKELDASISGSGSVAYHGNPDRLNSHSSGSGKVRKL